MEKTYFDSGPNFQDSKDTVIMRMLEKPKKPDFKQLPKSECFFFFLFQNNLLLFYNEVLAKAKIFLPDFMTNTETLLKDEKEIQKKRIDKEENLLDEKKITKLKDLNPPSQYIYKTGTFMQATDIKMVIFIKISRLFSWL